MSRNYLIAGVVVVLLLLGGGYLVMNQFTQAPAAVTENNHPLPSVQASVSTEKNSLKNFMTMTGTQKCQFTDSETGNSGTVYVASGKFRGDFSSNFDGKVTPSHMINDSKDVYIWMDDQATGFKTNLEAIEQMSGQTGVSQSVDINKEVDYKCESWSIDPDMFVVPGDKNFSDMSKMMQDAAKMMQSTSPNASAIPAGNPAACAACDNLEGAAVTQCKTALKCN